MLRPHPWERAPEPLSKGSARLEGRRHAMDLVPSFEAHRCALLLSRGPPLLCLHPFLSFWLRPAFWQGLGAGSLSHSRFGANNPAAAVPGGRDGAHQEERDLELDTKMCVFSRGVNDERMTSVCDYSLQNVQSRPARIGDELVTRDFGTGTRGFAARESSEVVVCLLPGTELAFPQGIAISQRKLFSWNYKPVTHKTAIFRQINKGALSAHHDALEFPDGLTVLLTTLPLDQQATVLQLPAHPRNPAEAAAQQRTAYVG